MREGKSVLRVFLSRSYFHIEDFSSLVNLFLRKGIKYFTCIMRIFPHTLLMENEKELIKSWLKKNKKSREWLAQKCFVKKASVDDWFRSKGIIPPAKLELIRKEINRQGEEAAKTASSVPILNGVAAVAVPLSEDDLKLISKAAQISGQTIEEFIRSAALEDAGE